MESQEKNKVTISKEDAKNVRDFFNHFNIALPSYLDSVISTIENTSEITTAMQQDMKINLARSLAENKDHELLKDELFNEVMPNCEKVWFDKQFEEDFESEKV